MTGERDQEARERFARALDGGGSIAAAARAAGVGRTVPYTWAKRGDTKVSAAIERAQARGGQGRARPPGAEVAHGVELRELALDRLRELLEDKELAARDTIGAARAIAALAPPPRPLTVASSLAPPESEEHEDRAAALARARTFLRDVPR